MNFIIDDDSLQKPDWRHLVETFGAWKKEYAKKVAYISPRILSEFENGVGNPTLATLQKIASPFGLRVRFMPPEAWRPDLNEE